MNKGFSQSISKKGFTLLTWHAALSSREPLKTLGSRWAGSAWLSLLPQCWLDENQIRSFFTELLPHTPEGSEFLLSPQPNALLINIFKILLYLGALPFQCPHSVFMVGIICKVLFYCIFFHSQGRESIFFKQETLILGSFRLGRSWRGLCHRHCSEERECNIQTSRELCEFRDLEWKLWNWGKLGHLLSSPYSHHLANGIFKIIQAHES